MRNIKLADGSVYSVSVCGAANGLLHLCVTSGDSVATLCAAFDHPENLTTIEHYFEGTETDHVFFTGYTILVAASRAENGVNIILQKGG